MIKITRTGNKITFEIEHDVLGGKVEGFAGPNDLAEQMKLGTIAEDPTKPILLRLACVAKIDEYTVGLNNGGFSTDTMEDIEKSLG
jgi:hypothetical protein